jgi:DNA invertase Pin-like site-specific DNA recombinase
MNGNRAAVYVRVSSTGQAEDGSSLSTQEAACRAYTEQHGLRRGQDAPPAITGNTLTSNR